MKPWIRALSQPGWAPVIAYVLAALGATSLSAQEFRARGGSTVTLGARVQAQFEASGSDETPSSFFIRRAWVTIDGRLNDFVSARAQYDINGDKVLEAYLALNPSEDFQIQLGQFKRAISTFWLAANFDLPLIERDGRVPGVDPCPGVGNVCSFGRLTGGLGLDAYEPGILLNGSFSESASLRVTVTNGEGINGKDRNSAKSTAARLTLNTGSNSRFHAYGVMDETVDRDGDTKWVPAYGLEFELGGWRNGPHLLVSGIRGRNWKAEAAALEHGDDVGFTAFQAMGLWYFPLSGSGSFEAIEPLLRVSWAGTRTGSSIFEGDIEVNDDVNGLLVTPGFMLYATGRTGISTNLDIYSSSRTVGGSDYESVDTGPDWSLRVQAFVTF
ncbi:MAG: porin [Gemmatimonadota bacterium]|nr:porin [Gemmatimonadota bacterium]MDE2985062.1 porin [Gemmatimonadota bacterium]